MDAEITAIVAHVMFGLIAVTVVVLMDAALTVDAALEASKVETVALDAQIAALEASPTLAVDAVIRRFL